MKTKLNIFLLCLLPLVTAAQNQLVPQTGHNGSFRMVLSHDDKKLLTAGIDGRIMLWDVAGTKALHNIKPGTGAIYSAAWDQNGSRFAIGTADSLIVLFDGNTAGEIKRFKTPCMVMELCFHPKMPVLAFGGNNGVIKVMDIETGSVYFSFQPDIFVTGLEFSSNGAILFTAGWNNGVTAYEMNRGKNMLHVPTRENVYTSGMQLSASNEILFMQLQNGTTEMVNLADGKNLGSISNTVYYENGNETYYLEPVMTADNLFVISVDKANNLVISSRESNTTLIYNNTFSKTSISSIVPSHDGQFFLVADMEGRMSSVYFNQNLFKSESPLLWRKLQASPERIYHINFMDRDETLALTGLGHYRFNMATGDLHRRDQDSAVVSDREYPVRYFMTDRNPDVYYYADLLRHTGYEIRGNHSQPLASIAFSKDTGVVALVNGNKELLVYDIKQRKLLVNLDVSKETGFTLFNSTMNDRFVYQKGPELTWIDTKGEITHTMTLASDISLVSICTDREMKTLYVLDSRQLLTCYDLTTSKNITLPGALLGASGLMMDLSADGKTLALAGSDAIKFYRTAGGEQFFEVRTGNEAPSAFAFTEQGDRVAVALENGITQLWDLSEKQKIMNMMVTPQEGILVYTDDHYYMATKEAARHLVFVHNNQPVSLANAELAYNRPDKVLEKIGLSDQRLINAYRFAYERRLKRSKTNTQATAAIPQISLLNQHELKTSTDNGTLFLRFKVIDTLDKLARLHVWINNVPVYGLNGMALEAKSRIEKEIALNLVSGTNHIKFSTVNTKGMESDKQEITVVYTQTEKPDLYLLTIGTSNYKNAAFNLTYAAKDANDMAALFSSLNKNNDRPYGRVLTKTLTNEEVTREGLMKTKEFLKQARSNDVVMIFVAGHGVRDEQMKYYFGTYDMNFDKPGDKGFSEEDFAQLADGLKALRKLIFFDTCLSGELDKEEAEQVLASNTVIKDGDIAFRTAGAGVRARTSGLENASALMREIYNDLDEGTGSTVISSAGGAEFAMESSEWKNGLFTYCFLNGLKNLAADKNGDKQVTVNEIQDYVRREVVRLSKGKQQPSFKDENILMNYRVW